MSDLDVKFRNDGLHQVTGFDIIDISENKWEHAKFQIEDYGKGTIGFYCRNIKVNSVSEITYFDLK